MPLACCEPDQAPEAVQEETLVEDHESVELFPRTTEAGLTEIVTVGAGLMVKLSWFEVPPPGVGFTAVTFAVPADATSEAEMEAVNCEALTKVVDRALLFHSTVAPETKLLPFTVSVKAPPPAIADPGEMELMDGAGLEGGGAGLPEEPPPHADIATAARSTAFSAHFLGRATRP